MITTQAHRSCTLPISRIARRMKPPITIAPISDILADFSTVRLAIVERLARMSPTELARTALHPRLRQPMSVVDLCFFVAEHDDHHLRTIAELRSRWPATP